MIRLKPCSECGLIVEEDGGCVHVCSVIIMFPVRVVATTARQQVLMKRSA